MDKVKIKKGKGQRATSSSVKNRALNQQYIKNDWYKAIIQSATEGFLLIKHPQGDILDANDAFCQMIGYSRDELLSMKIQGVEVGFAETSEEINKRNSDFEKTGEALFKTRYKRKDGEIIDVAVSLRYLDEGLSFCFHRDVTEQKHKLEKEMESRKYTEEALKASEGSYQALIELGTKIGEAVIMLQNINGREGVYTYVSDQWPIITGYTKKELLGMSFFDLVSLQDREVSINRHRQKMSGKTIPDLFELSIIRKDGAEVPIEITSAVTTYNGKLANVVYIRDITKRRQEEEALRISEEKLRLMFESLADGVTVTDLKGNILQANDATAKLHGLEAKEELIGKSAFELIAKKDHARAIQNLRKTLEKGYSGVNEYTFVTKDGREFAAELNATTLKDASSKPIGFIAITRDTTERKQAEEKHRAIIRTAVDGFWMNNLEGRLLEVNDSYCKMIGYTQEELLEMSICDIEAIEGPEDVIRHIQQLKKMGYTRFESRHKCKDGKIIDVEVSSNYLDTGRGQIFSFLRDITERKRIEEELDKYRDHLEELVEKRTAKLTDANEQLQIQMEQRIEFTRALVHELKTPLTPIRIASELLISTLQEEPWLSCAKKINKGALNLSRRIDDLLDLARSEMGILKLEYESVDLNQMLSEVADYMVEEANKIGLSLTLDLPPFLSPLRCDRERLQQVVLNLLDNAFKFTPNGGRITLKARQRNSTITVEVQDTGPVIAKEEQKRLFQPYHRLERDRKHLSGLGLGLAICKVLVELHEGQIWLESQYGKGNSFVFTIPIKSLNQNKSMVQTKRES